MIRQHTSSLNDLPAATTLRFSPTFQAPRPLSQHSLVVYPTRPASRAGSPALRSRPASPLAAGASTEVRPSYRLPQEILARPTSGYSFGSQSRDRSSPVNISRPTNITELPVQRVITGVWPTFGRQAQEAPSRLQTMNIGELDAKHRRRMSDLQSGSIVFGDKRTSAAHADSAKEQFPRTANAVTETKRPPHRRSATVDALVSSVVGMPDPQAVTPCASAQLASKSTHRESNESLPLARLAAQRASGGSTPSAMSSRKTTMAKPDSTGSGWLDY